ncbi:MAG: ATP-dependent zinc metalloprotease FtsH [Mangrovibacterium sp.]
MNTTDNKSNKDNFPPVDNDTKKRKDNNKSNFNPLSNGGKVPKFNPYWIYGVMLVVILSLGMWDFGGEPIKINKSNFFQMLEDGDVEKLVMVNDKAVRVYIKEESLTKYDDKLKKGLSTPAVGGPQFRLEVGRNDNFAESVKEIQEEQQVPRENRVYVDSTEEVDYFGAVLGWLFPFILIIAFWMYMFRRMNKGAGGPGGGGIFSVGKSQAKVFDKGSKVNVTFKEVAGLSEAKQEIEEIVSFLKSPEKYTKLGGKIPKGALLVGPPGTGKTLLAKAVAGEAHVPFFSMSGSDFVEMFVGVGASRVRDLFKQAKEKSPCIIFIDEIDAIGRARGNRPNMGSNDERENTLNQLLTEMDGFDTNSGIIILAATNRAEILDSALMRAGRFDRQIQVELPDLNEREDIFKVHLRNLKLNSEVKVSFLAKQTPGFSGADIANVCNEAALIAARKDHETVMKQDFLDAVDRIIGGLEKKNKIISADEKKRIAFHEAGHAAISWLLEFAHPLVKVTIVPRGKALGAAWYLPEERSITTKEQLLDEMCSTLGGRAAEELAFGNISSGAQNDLEKVTKTAYAMISIYGMSAKVGNFSYYDSTGQSDYSFTKPYSEKTAILIDEEAKSMIDEQYQRALQVLKDNEEGHHKLAEKLLEKEVIFGDDLEEIFGKRPWQSSKEVSRADAPTQATELEDLSSEVENQEQ